MFRKPIVVELAKMVGLPTLAGITVASLLIWSADSSGNASPDPENNVRNVYGVTGATKSVEEARNFAASLRQ